MNTNTRRFLPSTKLGRCALWSTAVGLAVFAVTSIVARTSVEVVNTNTGQEAVGNVPTAVNTGFISLYLLFAAGILGTIAIAKRDRAIGTWLAVFFGVVALLLSVGDIMFGA